MQFALGDGHSPFEEHSAMLATDPAGDAGEPPAYQLEETEAGHEVNCAPRRMTLDKAPFVLRSLDRVTTRSRLRSKVCRFFAAPYRTLKRRENRRVNGFTSQII